MIENTSGREHLRIVGIGEAGSAILGRLSAMPDGASLDFIGLDLDEGIDERISDFLKGADALLFVAGLGTDVSRVISGICRRVKRKRQIPCVILQTLPFSFEGKKAKEFAESTLSASESIFDIVFSVPSDLLFSRISADEPVSMPFAKVAEGMAAAVIGVASLLEMGKGISSNVAAIRSLLQGRRTHCSIGVGVTEGTEDKIPQKIFESILASPFCCDVTGFKTANVLITGVSGNFPETGLKKISNFVSGFCGPETSLFLNCSSDDSLLPDQVKATVIILRFAQSDEQAISGEPVSTSHPLNRTDVEMKDRLGRTPLYLAVREGDSDRTSRLLENGADIHDGNIFKQSPLHIAVMKGRINVVRFLLNNGASPKVRSRNGATPLHHAAENGDLDIARLLVEHGADVNANDESLCTPLMNSIKTGNIDLVRYLIERGANVNATDYSGWTVLHHAALCGEVGMMAFFTELGADPDATDRHGTTPREIASAFDSE